MVGTGDENIWAAHPEAATLRIEAASGSIDDEPIIGSIEDEAIISADVFHEGVCELRSIASNFSGYKFWQIDKADPVRRAGHDAIYKRLERNPWLRNMFLNTESSAFADIAAIGLYLGLDAMSYKKEREAREQAQKQNEQSADDHVIDGEVISDEL